MSKEIFVAFATQKGGIGKSTVTALAASYLHNVKGYNVAVVDCDDPQHSIHGLREHEMGLIDSSTYFKALACDHFRRIKKNAYTIVKSNAVNALDDAERMIATEDVKPDVVFFDMPGTLRSNGVIKTLSQMDYIFTPLSADRFVVESTLKFVTMFRDRLMTTGQAKTKGLHLFWTMVDGRERNDLYGIYEEVIAEMGFPVLSTRLPDSKKFRRDLSEERIPLHHLPDGHGTAEREWHPGVFRRDKRHHQTAVSMGSRKVNTEGIDEELLLASIGRRTQDGTLRPAQEVPAAAPTEEDTAAPEPSPVQPVTREKAQRESGRRKRQDEDYNELFLRRNEIKTRQCVYISRDVHGKILRIVNDIAGGEISVGGYVDTVLRQHLEQHKERINELYKKQREDLI